jgi:hypothetical protein
MYGDRCNFIHDKTPVVKSVKMINWDSDETDVEICLLRKTGEKTSRLL